MAAKRFRVIHIVFGQSGYYEDHTVWMVRAFESEAAAVAWKVKVEAAASRARAHYCSLCKDRDDDDPEFNAWHERYERAQKIRIKLDPDFNPNSDTSYYVAEVKLYE